MGGSGGAHFVQQGAYLVDQVDIARLILAADVVAAADLAARQHGQQGIGVVFDIKPVADVCPSAINRDRFARQGVQDHDRDQLFGEMEGAVVVGAVGQHDGQAVGLMPGADEVI